MVVVVVAVLLPNFILLHIRPTSNGNKTANIYVKNCSVYIQCKGDIVVVDIKQQNYNLKIQTSPLHNVRRTLLTV